jgi:pimeloyl-ACP methyl ester carboxylesterase
MISPNVSAARPVLVPVEASRNIVISDEGRGRAIVIVPGWPLGAKTWTDNARDLVARGFRVIRIDPRGFGRSSNLPGPYNYDRFAADIDAVLKSRHIDHVTLVGHSMGGAVAAHYAAGIGRGRVAALVLVAAAGPVMVAGGPHPGGVPQKVFDGIIDGVTKDRSAFLTGFIQAYFATPPSTETVAAFRAEAMQASPGATIEAIRQVSREDLTTELPLISARVTIIQGESDQLVPAAQADWWAKAIPKATVRRIPSAGHDVYISERVLVDGIIATAAAQKAST